MKKNNGATGQGQKNPPEKRFRARIKPAQMAQAEALQQLRKRFRQ